MRCVLSATVSLTTMLILKKALADVIMKNGSLTVPVLMNCHSLTKCDLNGEHETTYERVPKPTPKFLGKTLFEWM